MATAYEKRISVRDKYKTIIGRNKYSQNLRNYCYKKYSDGNYYSDCSSSIMKTYAEVGYPIDSTCLNTAGMWQCKALKEVPVKIKNGVVQNPEVLQLCDMLLFAGTDSGRAYVDYVGHVEMVGEISGSTVYLYGHGSGTPRRTEMNAYCKSRYSSKTSTKVGNKGLLKVVRFIQDDGSAGPTNNSDSPNSSTSTRILKNGMAGSDVKALQTALIRLGYACGSWGADGDFGDATEAAVRAFQQAHSLAVDGEVGEKTAAALSAALAKLDNAPVDGARVVRIDGGQCYVRSAPNTDGAKLGAVKEGETLPYGGEQSNDGWLLVAYKNQNGWVSGKYGKLEGRVVRIVNGNCYVRADPNPDAKALGVVMRDEFYEYAGEISDDGWYKINYNGATGWVSGLYSELN